MEGADGWLGVGAIVWVRRRNGSWWPGRILGPGELAESHLMSPRSGTPVKLLGREDASVDWYNLEKSKRVKPFRCGEFDACIQKAEASQKIPIKKREKYARREDAILHALELEKQQNLDINSSCLGDHSLGALRRERSHRTTSEFHRSGCHSISYVHTSQTLSRVTSLPEEDKMCRSFDDENLKNFEPFNWKEDPSEVIPQIRGLQDFGMHSAPSKKKLSQAVHRGSSHRSIGTPTDVFPNAGWSVGGAGYEDNNANSWLIRGKRSHACISEESPVRRRDRRQPLVKVLQKSRRLPDSHCVHPNNDSGTMSMQGSEDPIGVISRAKRSRCVFLPADASNYPEHLEYLPEDTSITATQVGTDTVKCRAKRSRCVYLPSDAIYSPDNVDYPCEETQITSDQVGLANGHHPHVCSAEEYTHSSSFETDESDSSATDSMETYVREETNFPADSRRTQVQSSNISGGQNRCEPSAFLVAENGEIVENGGMPTYSSIPHYNTHKQIGEDSAEAGMYKWYMKEKCNYQDAPRRAMDVIDGISPRSTDRWDDSSEDTSYDSEENSLKMGRRETSNQSVYHRRKFNHAFEEGTMFDNYFGIRRRPLSSQGVEDSSSDSDDDSHVISASGWELDGPSHMVRRAYWEESEECSSPVYSGFNEGRKRVLLDVDLKVQASYQREHVPWVSMMTRSNGRPVVGHPIHIKILEDGSTDLLVPRNESNLGLSTAPFSSWTTARRTAKQRIPRLNPTLTAMEGKHPQMFQHSNIKSKHPSRDPLSAPPNREPKLGKKNGFHARQPSSENSQRKASKRASLSGQKTRTLSSFSSITKRGDIGDRRFVQRDVLGGLTRPEGAIPLVSCVPVKVVFSRILEAIGRQRSAHRVLLPVPQ